jgi:hypothetical protein
MGEKKQARPSANAVISTPSPLIFVFPSHFAQIFLNLAYTLLDFSFDFLSGVALDGPGNFVGLALDLFHFTGNFIFAAHWFLQVKDIERLSKAVPMREIHE